MTFAETRLDLGIDYGTRASLRFSTSVIVDGAGSEQRNANWSQPLGRWQLGERSVVQSELDYFQDFHATRKGAAVGFRFKDWTDYQAKSQRIGTGDGTTTDFQLSKTYRIAVYTAIRPITKPVSGTVKIYSNGIQLTSGWSVDISKGVVSFASPPAMGAILLADFEFDVPVRFESDKIDFRFDAYEVGSGNAIFHLQNLSLVELRLAPTVPIIRKAVPVQINDVLNLGYDYGTVGGPAYNTTIAAIGAAYEKRASNWDSSKKLWQVGDRTLTKTELDYLIAFFRVCRGSAIGFFYKDWASGQNVPVRFEGDSIEFRFDAIDVYSNNAIFYLSGITCVEIKTAANVAYNAIAPANSISGISSCYLVSYDCVNGACTPVAGMDGRYQSLRECQATIVRPSFNGGQCATYYDVAYQGSHACNAGFDCEGSNQAFSGTVRVLGPVEGIGWDSIQFFPGAGNSTRLNIVHNGGEKKVIIGCSGGICTAQGRYTARIVSIVRVDGLPDNCGDPSARCQV